jgi:hypothetical protein
MKTITLLASVTLLATSLFAAESEFKAEFSRLQEAQQRAIQTAVAPLNRKYAETLQALMRRAAAASDFETAATIKAELEKLGISGGVSLSPAVPQAPPPTATNSPAKGAYTVDSRSDTGTLIGAGKKNQKVRAEYVEGLWSTNGKLKVSPDSPPHAFAQVAIVGVVRGTSEIIAVIPGGTKNKPHIETLAKDYDEIRLMINDTSKEDNSGEVTYKVSIR